MTDEVEIAVDACVGWHDSWMRAFGLRTQTDADAWRLLDRLPQPWYFAAITRRPDAPPESVADAHGTVCDAWSCLDLELFGFERHGSEPWFFRPRSFRPGAVRRHAGTV